MAEHKQFSQGELAHFEISGPDGTALRNFYESVLGWSVEEKGPGFSLVRTAGAGPDGAFVEAPEPAMNVGFTVADLSAAVAKAEASGGAVVMPVTDNGWVKKAKVRDVAGNTITLIEM
ncbi:MAG: VOC family protein [Myxococcota bacterium]